MSEQQDKQGPVRGRHGKFDRSPDTAALEAEAVRLRARGLSYRAIAERQGAAVSTVYDRVQSVMRATIAEPAEELRTLELQRLDEELERLADLEEEVSKVLKAEHITVQQGRVVLHEGKPLPDDTAKLAAVDRLLRIDEQRRRNGIERRKLLGLDAAQKLEQKVDLSGGLRYEIVGVDPADLT